MNTEKIVRQPVPQTKGQTIPWASVYDTIVWLFSFGQAQAFRKTTIELAQIESGDKVLDVGCGTGDLTLAAKAVAGPTGEVYGTDAAPEMIKIAQKKAAQAGVEVTFQVDLVERMTFSDNQFDIVLSSLMMHHLPDDLKREGLAEIYRVLKPGGRLLIVEIESSNQSFFGRLSDLIVLLHGGHTAMANNAKKLVPLMEAVGFTAVETGQTKFRSISFVAGKKAPAT